MKKFLAGWVVLAAFGGSASACPMCKDSVPNMEGDASSMHDSYDSNGQNISGGINGSVYFMLASLFGTMGLVSAVVVKGVRGTGAQGRQLARTDTAGKPAR